MAISESKVYYSQHGEDKFLEQFCEENKVSIIPTIVDVGAGDGVFLSNSKFFIDNYDFKALLIEPNTAQFDAIPETENVKKYKCIVSNVVEQVSFIEEGHWSLNHSNIDPNGDRTTQPLSKILDLFKIRQIGILSIDTEGSDTKILKEILTTDTRPQFIIVEGNTKEERIRQRKIADKKGYYRITKLNVNQIFYYPPQDED